MVQKLNSEIEVTLENLKANSFNVSFAENSNAAKETILNLVGEGMIVGIADSATVRQIGIVEELARKDAKVLNPFSMELTMDPTKILVRDNMSRHIFLSDVLIAGTNAVTKDGKLVNIDAVGNRVASMIFGPKKVVIVVGKNKIVKDLDEALYRIKNVIAPFHARTKKFATPCAQTNKCMDCSAPRRICSVTTIMEKRPWRTDVEIILINEDLGLSWDETWSEERINKIKANYENATWVFASAKATQDSWQE